MKKIVPAIVLGVLGVLLVLSIAGAQQPLDCMQTFYVVEDNGVYAIVRQTITGDWMTETVLDSGLPGAVEAMDALASYLPSAGYVTCFFQEK